MSARLVWERDGATSSVVIGAAAIVVGRDPTCVIRGTHPELAARHCRIVKHGAVYRVEHLEGAPTRVNGNAIAVRSHVLADGDEIACAGMVVRFIQRGSSPSLPRMDAETQRLPLDLAIARVKPVRVPAAVDPAARLAVLERELAELRAELVRVLDENQRLESENRRLREP